ncbi:MAG: alpha/beta fold hydrolase [Pseudomonadota bacterium]
MNVDLHFEQWGEGPPVLFLHGLFGSGRNWQTIAKQIAKDFTVYALDARNHGRSPHHPSMTYDDMVADVLSFADRHHLDRFTLVGHSMGGKAAMTLAMKNAERLLRLVIVDIAPVSYPDRFVEMIDAMLALDLGAIERRKQAEQALTAAIPEVATRLFILQNLVFRDGTPSWRFNLPDLRDQMPHILGPLPVDEAAHFDGPTHFIRGELSDRIKPEHQPLLAQWFPNHTMQSVSGGGHWPHAEAPQAFLEIFIEALKG